MRRFVNTPAVLAVLTVLAACGGRSVTRIDPGTVMDLSGRWNATDAQLIANAMIPQALNGVWVTDFMDGHSGNRPTVVVGEVNNRTSEHIDMNVFLQQLEAAFINSGDVRVVAGAQDREALRSERRDQQTQASDATRRQMYRERGADYMLTGTLTSVNDRLGGREVIYYQANLWLVDLESNERVWAGQHQITKYVERPRVRS